MAATTGKQRMTPSEAFVETLVAQGVRHVFGIVGSAYMDALDLFPAAGIRFISTVHEQGAAHMADGYARVTGTHGVCVGQNGPGITNFVTAIAAAYWAHSPVVAVTPETGSLTIGLGGFQETDQLPIFSRITKYQAHVNHPSRMAELTARAFDRAVLEMGPTQLNIPRDYFYGELECEIPAPIRIERGPGGSASLDAAADALAHAAFPVIIAGGGVVMANGSDALIALAEALDAPVCNAYLHTDSFPAGHRLWCGPLGYHGSKAAMNVLAKADVVLALGSRLGPFGVLPQYGFDYWPAHATLIQVDADPRVLGLVKKTSVTVNGDAREAALALTARLKGRPLAGAANREQRLAAVHAEKDAWGAELASWDHERDTWSLEVAKGSAYMHPRPMLRELEKAMPADAMVSTDIGNICQIANSYLKFDRPRSMFGAMMFGNCGYAFPTMIGCKVGAPDTPRRGLRRRRRLGHELRGDPHLRARAHPGDRRRVQQSAVGRGEEEPRRLLFQPLPRREPGEPELRRHRPGDGRGGDRRRPRRGCRRRVPHGDARAAGRQDHDRRDDVHAGVG